MSTQNLYRQYVCIGKYIFALLIAFITLMIYYSKDFEQLKTSFIILIGIETLAFLLIDYYWQDEMIELQQKLDRLNLIKIE